MSRDVATCFTWHTGGIATIEEAMKREVLVGSSGATGYEPPVSAAAQCADRHQVQADPGLSDSAAVGIAMERGEVEGYCSFTWGSIKSARPQWIEDKLINIMLQLTLSSIRNCRTCRW